MSLERPSKRGLGKTSAALNKASIVSIAKQSRFGDASVIASGEEPWHACEAADVLDDLATSATDGLAAPEAARRLQEFGANALTPAKRKGFLAKLWAQLNSTVIYILLAAAIIEGAFQAWAECGLVLAVIVINTAIGLFQEGRAEKAADAIKAMLSPTAKVLRDGQLVTIPAEELVPGDIVTLKSGDKVPADLRLLSASNLQVQEAMLTGESVPTSKITHPVPAGAPLGDRKNLAFSATTVVSGTAEGVVVGTGDSAEIGQINKMVSTVEEAHNNLTHQLTIFGRWLAVLVGVVALVSFLLALLRAGEGLQRAFETAVSISVAIIPEGLPAIVTIVLAIGTTVMARNNAIIRQLPAVETLGSVNVICSDKTGTLTRNEMTVVAVRTAASLYRVSGVGYAPVGSFTLAFSPTPAPVGRPGSRAPAAAAPGGTPATEGDLQVVIEGAPSGGGAGAAQEAAQEAAAAAGAPLDAAGMAVLRALLEGAVLCNDSALSRAEKEGGGSVVYTPMGAPTEVALLTAGEKAGLEQSVLKASKPRLASVPFESEHKFMATVHNEGGARVMYVKGAPDRLLPLCRAQVADNDVSVTSPLDIGLWQQAQADLSNQGLRVLALCRTELAPSEDLTSLSPADILGRGKFLDLVMMLAILDPPRDEAVQAIKVAHKAGITVKMITGDHSLTALAIGRMLNIAGSGLVLTGPEVDRIDDEGLKLVAKECNVFARASPENKLRIVRALQASDLVVAMTGDGVNDAPALKAADVGVAMGITGTDVSKEAAKMVLADDNFASIVAAVREGRRVWDNIRKILVFNLPVNLAQGFSIMYSYVVGLPDAPLTALQVLLVNLVTSVTLGLALAAEPPEPTTMERPPRRAGKRLIGKLLLWRMFFVCHVVVVLVIGMFYWGERDGLDLGMRRAEAFSVLVGSQVAYFVNCRFLKASTLHPRVLHGNRIAYASIFSTLALVVFLVYTPGVNAFFHQAPMNGIQWARTICCIAAVYLIVEAEKAAVDPIVMPVLRPAMSWMEARVPSWLSFDWSPERARRAAAALCAAPKVKTGPLHRRSAVRRVARGGSCLAAGPGGAPAPAPRGGAVGEEAA